VLAVIEFAGDVGGVVGVEHRRHFVKLILYDLLSTRARAASDAASSEVRVDITH